MFVYVFIFYIRTFINFTFNITIISSGGCLAVILKKNKLTGLDYVEWLYIITSCTDFDLIWCHLDYFILVYY